MSPIQLVLPENRLAFHPANRLPMDIASPAVIALGLSGTDSNECNPPSFPIILRNKFPQHASLTAKNAGRDLQGLHFAKQMKQSLNTLNQHNLITVYP